MLHGAMPIARDTYTGKRTPQTAHRTLIEMLIAPQMNRMLLPSRRPPFIHGENRFVLPVSAMIREKVTTIRMNRMSLISFDANWFPHPSLW
jgi:hypothetical protein